LSQNSDYTGNTEQELNVFSDAEKRYLKKATKSNSLSQLISQDMLAMLQSASDSVCSRL